MPGGGSIVINGSMVSVKGIAGLSTLAASKAALRSFARTWPVELKGRNIRVNVISPGTVITPGYKTQFGLSDGQIEHMKSHTADIAPLGRTGTPEEIANAVVFLASEESSYITGIELFVDGGTAQI
jgi:NAD(P)-dependent dehydrogenase (short-subunit alcohol dehydrogenase family)